MIYLSGSADHYTANACAQAVSAGAGVPVQVIAPSANTGGVYIARLLSSDDIVLWRAASAAPSSGDLLAGVRLAPEARGAHEMGVIIPPGNGVYLTANTTSAYTPLGTIFYCML